MASASAARLTELLSGTRRLALVGLAKNTGKTETLAAILAEHAAAGTQVGVTSIGRDGEAHDVIDARIDKPRVRLQAGSLVATHRRTAARERRRARAARADRRENAARRSRAREAVRAGHDRSRRPERRRGRARRESRRWLELGAEQVLIDGAIDRRAASSPAVADGLVMATGAVLGEDIERGRRDHRGTRSISSGCPARRRSTAAPEAAGRRRGALTLERRLVLNGEPAEIAALLRRAPQASTFAVDGALSERFLEGLLAARRSGPGAS